MPSARFEIGKRHKSSPEKVSSRASWNTPRKDNRPGISYATRMAFSFAATSVMTVLIMVGVVSVVWGGVFSDYTRTNMEDIYYSPADINQANLFTLVDNVKPDRTAEDLLFQVMLELGATLDSKIEHSLVDGKTVWNVADGYIVACFDKDVTDDVVKAIAKMQPQYAVLRDTSMVNDSTATNFEQIFKTYSPNTTTKIL